MFNRKRDAAEHAPDDFMTAVRAHVGYTALPGKQSTYGKQVGYDGVYWGGAFIDVAAKEAGMRIPSCVYPPAALAEFTRTRKFYLEPARGDIAFFSFSNDGAFGVPHVGIVTSTEHYLDTGLIETIEGNTASAMPRMPQDTNGVYPRARWRTDFIGFGRPDFTRPVEMPEPDDETPSVRPAHFIPHKSNSSVRLVQIALGDAVGLENAVPGKFDNQTQSAYAAYMRKIGYVQPTGQPDLDSLRRLARDSGLFVALP